MQFLNFFTFLLVIFFLSGCSTVNYASGYSPRELECSVLAHSLSKVDEWQQRCVQDDAEYVNAYKANLNLKTPIELCRFYIRNEGKPAGTLSKEVAISKNINCETFRKKIAEEYASGLNMTQLCLVWNSGTGENTRDKAVREEVKSRGVDCPAMLSTISQRQIAQAQVMQATALQQQADAALIESLKSEQPVYTTPTKTNCHVFGNSISCHSY